VNTLYFTAAPNGEADGLFGSLSPAAIETNGIQSGKEQK